ncbi:MAG: aminoglycoside 3'-phosphotransferase [Clostridia bacterium]|nr:aminoglycoside 3'-phosphotransferase [Clostridia bacterium]
MKQLFTKINLEDFPSELHEYIRAADVYDSSSSPDARVYFFDTGAGLYLKTAPRGALYTESKMAEYFHSLGCGVRVIRYMCEKDRDYLLTEGADGRDLTEKEYLAEPKRLAVTLGRILRVLHEKPYTGCPVPDRYATYLACVEEGYRIGRFDPSYSLGYVERTDADSAYNEIMAKRRLLVPDTLIHGDFCLPNVILRDWGAPTFIDLGAGGVGDRHIDLFWGIWTLQFNLGTNKYTDDFISAYGADLVDGERLRLVALCECFG